MLDTALFAAFAFLCGSLPFSVWLGRAALGRDVRDSGDGNPGATNVWRAGGWKWGLLALMLDVAKGAFPLGAAAVWGGQQGLGLALIGCMPTLGHAFSPFLRGRGGKALAATLGAWIGLTRDETAAVAVVAIVLWTLLIRPDAWVVALTLATLGAHLALSNKESTLLLALAGQSAIILWKHRLELVQRPSSRGAERSGGRDSARSGERSGGQ